MIKIILAEDHNIVRDGIRLILESDKDFEVIGEADGGNKVLKLLAAGLQPDIILTDINMPDLDGLGLIKELKKVNSKARIIVLSMYNNKEYIINSFKEGASGYLMKDVDLQEIIFSIKHVNSGKRYLSSSLTNFLFEKSNSALSAQSKTILESMYLSTREAEILPLIADGLTSAEISERLFISKRTVEGHRDSLITKLGVKNTPSLIKFAVLHGLVD